MSAEDEKAKAAAAVEKMTEVRMFLRDEIIVEECRGNPDPDCFSCQAIKLYDDLCDMENQLRDTWDIGVTSYFIPKTIFLDR